MGMVRDTPTTMAFTPELLRVYRQTTGGQAANKASAKNYLGKEGGQAVKKAAAEKYKEAKCKTPSPSTSTGMTGKVTASMML
jgi:hypothetical protein